MALVITKVDVSLPLVVAGLCVSDDPVSALPERRI
jgi:hypothetical protein